MKKKQHKGKGKKALTAVGAVVAAGLAPGIISATPIQTPADASAADVVAIDGTAYGFDELYTRQKSNTAEMNVDRPVTKVEVCNATKYGVPVVFPPQPEVIERDAIFRSVEQMPQFPGGEAALKKYIYNHIKYPANAAKNNIQGRVIVQFVVNKNGSIGEVKVVRSVDKELDKEAVRVVKSLPKFTPGRQNGQAVPVWYTLPVTFKH